MTTDPKPAPPGDLGAAGQALWNSVIADVPAGWSLDEREYAILGLAARQADDLALLDAAVARDGAMSVGSKGQPVVHPALQEARQARITIGRLLGQLGLPDETGARGTAASLRGRRAAQARWRDRGTQGPETVAT